MSENKTNIEYQLLEFNEADYWQAERMKLINSAVSSIDAGKFHNPEAAAKWVTEYAFDIADTIIKKPKEEKK